MHFPKDIRPVFFFRRFGDVFAVLVEGVSFACLMTSGVPLLHSRSVEYCEKNLNYSFVFPLGEKK